MTTTDTLHHIYAAAVAAVKVTDTPRNTSVTGYGPKIPTAYMIQSFGPRPVWRRVYVVNYGNSGSLYVNIGGVNHYLSTGVEYILETVRDGGTLEAARDHMKTWPAWMANSEGFITPDTRYVITTSGYGTPGSRAADSAQIVLDWSGVLAHLQRAGVSPLPTEEDINRAIYISGRGYYGYAHVGSPLTSRVTVQGVEA